MPLTRRHFATLAGGIALATPAARAQGQGPVPSPLPTARPAPAGHAGPVEVVREPGPWLPLAQMIDLNGRLAAAGDAWRNGAEMALQEVNAAGGVLGEKLRLITFDGATNPTVARAATQRALGAELFAVFGALSGEVTQAIWPLVREKRLCLLTGADAGLPPPTPGLAPVSLSQASMLARLARWARQTAGWHRLLLVWSPTENGRMAHEAALAALRARELEVAADIALPPGDEAAEQVRLGHAGAGTVDAVLLLADADNAVRMLTEVRRALPTLPLVGTEALVAPPVLEHAGVAAIGLLAHAALTPDAPLPGIAAWRDRYTTRFARAPNAWSMKGAIAVGLLRAAAARLGRPDSHALADALRNLTVRAAAEPSILIDTTWNAAGEPDRVSFLAEVKPARQLAWSVLPPLGA
jgi:branched-chain amino acid transport system substrate-binding protein